MKNHVWRPLFVALALVALVLLARIFLVPEDFGIHERGYMYGWHRKGNVAEWKALPVKYRTAAYCKECHTDKHEEVRQSPHAGISCENCHGPAEGHPHEPPKLTMTIDRSRKLCLRCHARLPYRMSDRSHIKGINPEKHNPEAECTLCHYPHNPKRGA